jgi:hypothetical protein
MSADDEKHLLQRTDPFDINTEVIARRNGEDEKIDAVGQVEVGPVLACRN